MFDGQTTGGEPEPTGPVVGESGACRMRQGMPPARVGARRADTSRSGGL